MVRGLQRLWRGEQPLARAFWLYFVLGWIGFIILAMILHTGFFYAGIRPAGFIIMAAAYLAYPLFAGVGVWRSASAYPHHGFYRVAAKIVVVLVAAWIILALANGGALQLMDILTARDT